MYCYTKKVNYCLEIKIYFLGVEYENKNEIYGNFYGIGFKYFYSYFCKCSIRRSVSGSD